jgi:hypothetical protein
VLRAKANVAAERGPNFQFSGEPVWSLRHALAGCPDEAALARANDLQFIGHGELRDALRIDITEAYGSLDDGRWKAATVLAGSVLEALLVWRLSKYSSPERTAAVAASIPNARQCPRSNNPKDWLLWQLIDVAAHLEAISTSTAIQARLAKDYRNLIHPGRGERCAIHTALGALSGMESVVADFSGLARDDHAD